MRFKYYIWRNRHYDDKFTGLLSQIYVIHCFANLFYFKLLKNCELPTERREFVANRRKELKTICFPNIRYYLNMHFGAFVASSAA